MLLYYNRRGNNTCYINVVGFWSIHENNKSGIYDDVSNGYILDYNYSVVK